MKTPMSTLLGYLAVLACATCADAGLIINVNYTGDAQYAPAFATAATTWQNLLVGYQNGNVVSTINSSHYSVGQTVSTVNINAVVKPIDGPGITLGQAGPTAGVVDAAGFVLATDGIMEFDQDDVAGLLANNFWEPVILHEMAHVLGFGTLWTNNGVYVDETGEFTGINATAAWHTEFNQTGTPDVELGGAIGTRNSHWNEVDGSAGPTGIVDTFGRDMQNELMTGWLNSNPFISNMTVASFRDIGFSINAVPEPGTWLLVGLSLGAITVRRWWKKTVI